MKTHPFILRLNAELHRLFAPGLKAAINADASLPEWIQIAPYGEWPTAEKDEHGQPEGVQVFDRATADALVKRFNAWHRRLFRLARLNSCKGWLGHPDFAPELWPERNLLCDVLELAADDDGLNARMNWQPDVIDTVRKHKFPSVAWDTEITSPGRETPVMLWSVGFWHRPNIKGVRSVINAVADAAPESDPETEPNDTMLNKIIQALREAGIVKEGDSEDTVLAQVGSMIQSLAYQRESKAREAEMAAKMRSHINAAADAPLEELVSGLLTSHADLRAACADHAARLNADASELGTLRERVNALTAERDAERAARVNAILERLVESGRASKADADAEGADSLRSRLNADPDKAVELLQAPVRLNSRPVQIQNRTAPEDALQRTVRLNAWCDAHMAKNQCDYQVAWEASKADPEMMAIHQAMADADKARTA